MRVEGRKCYAKNMMHTDSGEPQTYTPIMRRLDKGHIQKDMKWNHENRWRKTPEQANNYYQVQHFLFFFFWVGVSISCPMYLFLILSRGILQRNVLRDRTGSTAPVIPQTLFVLIKSYHMPRLKCSVFNSCRHHNGARNRDFRTDHGY